MPPLQHTRVHERQSTFLTRALLSLRRQTWCRQIQPRSTRLRERESALGSVTPWDSLRRHLHMSGGSRHTEKCAVPRDRAIESLIQRELRSPLQHTTCPFRAQVLMADLVAGFIENLRFMQISHLEGDQFHNLKHADLTLIREIERFSAQLRIA